TFAAGNPLTADIPPGARLELDPARQVALRLPQRDAYYSDYSLQPQPASGSPLLDNALTHRALGRGRLVYWGFEPRDAVRRPWSTALLRLLVRNSVIWAAGASAATVEPWPRGKMAAAAVAQDVESQFGNARYALDSLRAAGFRGTYFLTSDLARRYDRLSHDLANGGEIGTHSENHRLLGGLPADLQRRRLEKSQDDLTAMFALPVEGLRPPEEQFDAATMSGWIAAGGRYVLGANDSRSASPELLPIGRDTIVLIGRVGSDDFAAAAATRNDTAKMAKLFLAEYRRIRGVGGAYVLSYHSQLLARPDFVPALARVARTLVSDTAVWVATTEEIAEWWRARAQLVATVRLRGDGFEVTVRNRGERLVRWAVLRVQLPEPRAVAGANAALLSTRGNEVRLLIPPVPGNVTRTYIVDYAGAKPRVSTRASSRLSPPRKKGRLWWWFRWWR
ncbi:MAG TPA: polysaccharide deacetylase family protein, partial [Gemmatimonadales bacterium]|nr:polysaccharide deacetylase family protein [Gemmatimonadales bacterium]